MEYAENHLHIGSEFWESVLYADGSKYNVSVPDWLNYV